MNLLQQRLRQALTAYSRSKTSATLAQVVRIQDQINVLLLSQTSLKSNAGATISLTIRTLT